jgi:O-antigen/teichoic acid export membrane protein
MTEKRTVFRNTLWGGLDMVVELLLPTITSVAVARVMGPTKLGAFAYIMWISLIASTLGTLGMPMAAMKYMADFAGQRRADVVYAIYRTGVRVQLVVGTVLVCAGLVWVWLSLPRDQQVFASLAILSVFPAVVTGMASAMNSTLEDLGGNVVPSIAGALTLAVATILTLVFDLDLVGLAASHLLSRVVDGALRFGLLSRRLPAYLQSLGSFDRTKSDRKLLPPALVRDVVRFCAQQSVLLLLALIVRNRSEMFFLKRFCALREVAFYSVAFGFAQLPAQMAAPFSAAAISSLFVSRGRSDEEGRRFVQVYWRYMALIVFPASLGLAAISGPLVRVLYGPQYYEAAPVLLTAAALGMVAPLATPPTMLATASGRLGILVRSGLIASVATLVFDACLVWAWGAVGGALANGLGQAVGTILVCVMVSSALMVKIPWNFTLRLCFASFGMTAVVAAFVVVVPDIVGLIVGPVLGVIAFGVLLRWMRVLAPEDESRLLAAERLFPAKARPLYRKLLHRIVVQPQPRTDEPT